MSKVIDFFKTNFFFILVVFVAVFLRAWNLVGNPPSLNWDEVSHGYNAYSILKTGKDEWGNTLPAIFRAYGDYKLPVYIYLTAISEFFFGLTPFAVRFVSFVAGIGTVITSYFLAKLLFSHLELSRNIKGLALLTTFFVAISPWATFLSRPAFEANLALFLFGLGMFLFLKYQQVNKNTLLLLSSVFFGLTVWTYNSYRIFTPMMLVVLVLLFRKQLFETFKKDKKPFMYSLIILFLFILPMFYQLLTSAGQARYEWVEILDQGMIARIEQARNVGGSRFLHNKVTYFSERFVKNYFAHFSLEFLFLEGGNDYQLNIPGRGMMYLINLPFFYIGFAVVVWNAVTLKHGKTSWRRNWILILSWILFAPVASSLTRGAPHVLRSATFVPMPMLLSALGLYYTFRRIYSQKTVYVIFSLTYFSLLLIQTSLYFKDYFYDYPNMYSRAWQYGYSDVVNFIKRNYYKYDKILVTKKYGEPHEFVLFYTQWEPSDYVSNSNLNRFYQSNWYWVDSFDKFYFINDWEISEKSDDNIPRSLADEDLFSLESGSIISCHGTDAKCLLVTSPGNNPKSWKRIQTTIFLDGSTAFEVYEN